MSAAETAEIGERRNSSTLRIGIIGAGQIAATHACAFERAGCAISAVADPTVERAAELARPYSASWSADLAALLEGDEGASVDAVTIVAPNNLHEPLVRRALAAGKHVLVEKPLATTVDDAESMVRAAAQANRVAMVVHHLLFHPVVVAAAAIVDSGQLGDLTSIHGYASGWPDLPPWDFRRQTATMGGGAWFDTGPHFLYVFERLMGPMRMIRGASASRGRRLEGEDAFAAAITFESGAVGTVQISYADRNPGGWSYGFVVHGTEGVLDAGLLPVGRLRTSRGGSAWSFPPVSEGTVQQAFDELVGEFVAAITARRAPAVTLADGARIVDYVLRGYESSTGV